ncbi:hypothetical protein BKA70DRAFT_1258479 [Coprinopsis sp. MPI-PUGE-AT-0042]|nr:hypothetical protein BKA70DRAFT_1258479 [Coprinopsis sp. MPI-PUGE-AT-0042]
MRGLAVGVGLAIIAHHSWPAFRRQTLAFKGFLVSGFTVTGLVFGAEAALLEHENVRRREENLIRRSARLDLARQGLIGTESEIAKWREAREQALASKPSESSSAHSTTQ